MGRRSAQAQSQQGQPSYWPSIPIANTDQVRERIEQRGGPQTAAARWVVNKALPEIDRRKKQYEEYGHSREYMLEAIGACARNVYWYCRDWVWCYDPRRPAEGLPAYLPMIPWREQREFISWIMQRLKNSENGLSDKYRGAGASFIFACVFEHQWKFNGGFSAAMSSRKLDLADKLGDPDSLLEKCRLVLRGLPPWFRPMGYQEGIHARFCLLENPETASVIKAEGGVDIGRGGRQTARLLDEYASMSQHDQIDAACVDSQSSLFYLSTPRGPDNPFSIKRFSGDIPTFTFHWQNDPRCDQAWYDTQVRKWGRRIVRQEIDLDHTIADDLTSIQPEWVAAATWRNIRPARFRRGSIVAALDVADSGAAESALVIRQAQTVLLVDGWHGRDLNETAHRAAKTAASYGAEVLIYDRIGVGAGIGAILNNLERSYNFEVIGCNWGEQPMPGSLDDAPEELNEDRFINQRALVWWTMRRRCEKAYESLHNIQVWPAEECLEIPDDSVLKTQMSSLRWQFLESGKTKLESKDAARRRGVNRLDRADALAMSFVVDAGGEAGILA